MNTFQTFRIAGEFLVGAVVAMQLGACGAPVEGGADEEPVAAAQSALTTDWSDPTSLCVTANGNDNSGTSSWLTLKWSYGYRRYRCDIDNGVGDGETQCCTPTYYAYAATSTSGELSVYNPSSDGFRFTTLTVKKGSDSWSIENFQQGYQMSCTGCNLWGKNCGSCWLDADGNGDCVTTTVEFTGSHQAMCNESTR